MTEEARAGRTRASRLSPARRLEILRVVVELVTTNGYQATTIDEIAARTGSSKATLYRRWGDKQHLVVAALKETSAIDIESIDTGDLASDLERLMEMFARHSARNIALVLTIAEAGRHDPALREAFSAIAMPELDMLDRIVASAHARGEIDQRGTGHLQELLVGILFTGALFHGDASGVDLAELRRYLHAVILPLLRGPAPG